MKKCYTESTHRKKNQQTKQKNTHTHNNNNNKKNNNSKKKSKSMCVHQSIQKNTDTLQWIEQSYRSAIAHNVATPAYTNTHAHKKDSASE